MAELDALEIPVVDITTFLSGEDRATAPAAVEKAATAVGFVQVVGHGVPRALLDAVYDGMARLSGLPFEEKQKHLTEGHPYRGFHMNRDAAGVVRQERFLVSRFDDHDDAVAGGVEPAYADFFYPNIWPDVPGLQHAVTALFEHTRALAGRMMSVFAVALGLDAGYFDPILEPNASTFAINHYPPRGTPLSPGDKPVLFAEHADGNTLTILHQRGTYNGLQIQPVGRVEWLDLPVVDDAFVINVGELMTRWTNDHWPSTRHRVVASSDPADTRTTLTTFHMPALDATVAPLAAFGGEDDPHYDPVTPYAWERAFITRNHTRRALEVDDRVKGFVEGLRA